MKLILSFWFFLLACVIALAAPTVKQAFSASLSQSELGAGLTSINYDGIQVAAVSYDVTETLFLHESGNLTLTSRPTPANRSSFVVFFMFLAAESAGIRLSQKGLDLVTDHVGTFPSTPYNDAMLQRLNDAFAAGQKVTGA